jgi:predicted phage terminase large subunit-like protein
MGAAIPLPIARKIPGAERSELVNMYKHYRFMSNEWVKRQILDNNRIDILASVVLGYDLTPMHLSILKNTITVPDGLLLCFRGAGKSTVGTIVPVIFYLLKDPNLRIVIASKTASNAQGFLREIKNHFETNERLREIFGPYYESGKMDKWDESEITVLPRTSTDKEASVTCVGVGQTIVSKHYDALFGDDLVDEDNSQTPYMRDKTETWYYKTLEPTLEPPSEDCELRGRRHIRGTRYHYDDQYGRWIKGEYSTRHLIIPALNEDGQSPWPEKWPPEEFARRRANSGLIIFNSQYQCDTEAMKGEIFQYDDCQMISSEDVPELKKLRIYLGVDLAISKKEDADHFAIVAIGVDKIGNIYVLDCKSGKFRFKKQTDIILNFAEKWIPERTGLESNGYQAAQGEVSKEDADEKGIQLNLKGRETDQDKVRRAWKLSPKFENKRVFFVKNRCEPVRDQIVMFPAAKLKDYFDALDHAIWASRRRKRKRRQSEPGII